MTNTFAQLRTLFEACVDLPDGERLAWLDSHVHDTGQRLELELMLLADRHDDGFLQHDVVSHIGRLGDADTSEFDPALLIGKRYGAFELLRLLGRGGQGAVYLAKRVDADFEQTAAVKLLRRGLHDALEHRRFRREREILARFEHPGVARLIDGGVSAEGVPYLVMEFVDGETIERWCESQRLDERARLTLFSELCEVVAAAHRQLIVHRDLKPSNVLVTTEGAVKVLDFGIARLLDEEESNTELQMRLITPGYGAPEQASGGTITLATDVHALGVLLRVLLTGQAPEGASTRLSPPASKELGQDLRWMIGRATAVEPELRYRDAADLNDDVQRYLDGRPVLAHPPSRWYQVRKFARRHRGGIAITMAFVIGILASLGTAVWQAKVAREQLLRAEAARDFLLGVFEAAKEDLPRDARPTPEVLVRAAARRLDSDTRLTPPMRAELLGTLSAISYSSNDYAQSIEQADHALAVLAASGDTRSRDVLALVIRRANAQVNLGKPEDADRALGERMAEIRSVSDKVTVEGLSAFAQSRIVVGHIDEAIALAKDAAQMAETVFGRDSDQALTLAAAHGDVMAFAGRNQEAAEVLEGVLAQWRASQVPPDHHFANSQQNLATAKYHLGDLAASERLMRESLALLRQIHTAPHEKIADALFSLGTALMDAGKNDEAEQVMLEAASMYTALFGPLHPQNAGMLDALGSLEMNRNRYAKAVEHLERATGICTEAKLHNHPDCARFWQNLSHAYLKLSRLEDAEAANARGLELRLGLFGDQHPAVAGSFAGRAAVLLARDQPDAALASIDQALAIFAATGQSESLGAATMRKTRATALKDLRRYPEALAVLDEADALALRLAPDNSEYRLSALALRAEILDGSGHPEAARAAARAALALDEKQAALSEERRHSLEAIAR